MKNTVENLVNPLVVESQVNDLEKAFASVIDIDNEQLTQLREEFLKMKEDIGSGDWGRIGVLAGMLWYKLDTLINHLSSIDSTLHNVERNTSKIK